MFRGISNPLYDESTAGLFEASNRVLIIYALFA